MTKPIFIAASPNTEPDDVALAKELSGNETAWSDQSLISNFEAELAQYFGIPAIGFDSARSAFFVLIKTLDLPVGSEVLLPAFSCMVVANAAVWAGMKPVFADCNLKSFGYDLEDLAKKITPNTRIIMVQHSFGMPEDIAKIREIAGPGVVIIEDLAHSLGGELRGQKLGTLGDAAILTFGIEKVISGVRGGVALVKDPVWAEKLKAFQALLPAFPKEKIAVLLDNPVFWTNVAKWYYFGFGKFTLGRLLVWWGHKNGKLGNMIEDCEYDVCQPDWLPAKPAAPLFALASNQFKKLDRFNEHRRNISAVYEAELGIKLPVLAESVPVFLRFPVLVNNRAELSTKAKHEKLVLGDWYKTILYAPEKALPKLNYFKGDCPKAETAAAKIINLPTHIGVTDADAKRIAQLVKPYLAHES